jgi:hypothetical protein
MIVAIQQPEHAPWMGFFHKMAHCDLFVYLDSVQFKKRYFENRNRIKTDQGVSWVTVPVQSKGRYHQRIDEVQIDNESHWVRKYQGTLEHAYGRAPFWTDIRDVVWPCLQPSPTALVSLNLALIESIRSYLDISVEAVRSSSMAVDAFAGSDLILAICEKLGADVYISGPDGRDYLDADAFEGRSIRVTYHDYEHPVHGQMHGGFVSHLSVLDLIGNCGPGSRAIVRDGCPVET